MVLILHTYNVGFYSYSNQHYRTCQIDLFGQHCGDRPGEFIAYGKEHSFAGAHGSDPIPMDTRRRGGYFIGCFWKNSHIMSLAEMFLVDFPKALSRDRCPGQVCPPPSITTRTTSAPSLHDL
jgi:hypothetical protein